ncbi:MAG TPA: hypothetical protein VK681_37090 [Reyranella sp.]|nr:hypothetical protein [Reyranella sp.]
MIGRAAHPVVELRVLLRLAALAMADRHDAARTPVRKPTVTAMSQSAYYLQQAEKCERQAAIAEPRSSGQSFRSAAAQWRGLAANAAQREAIKQDPAYGTGARTG